MEQELNNHLKIALASINCFTDDGTLDLGEINYLLGLAMTDNVIDDDEKDVLANIFNRVSQSEVSSAVWARISEIRARYSI